MSHQPGGKITSWRKTMTSKQFVMGDTSLASQKWQESSQQGSGGQWIPASLIKPKSHSITSSQLLGRRAWPSTMWGNTTAPPEWMDDQSMQEEKQCPKTYYKKCVSNPSWAKDYEKHWNATAPWSLHSSSFKYLYNTSTNYFHKGFSRRYAQEQ